MKFSIKFLFALMILGALWANSMMIQSSVNETLEEESKLRANMVEIAALHPELDGFKPWYDAALAGEKRLNEAYRASYEANKDLPLRLSKFDQIDKNLLAIKQIKLLNDGEQNQRVHFAYRIHVPLQESYFLRLQFNACSNLMTPAENLETTLGPGEHVVDLRMDYDNAKKLDLLVNDATLVENKLVDEVTGYSSSTRTFLGPPSESYQLVRVQPMLESGSPQASAEVFLKLEKREDP